MPAVFRVRVQGGNRTGDFFSWILQGKLQEKLQKNLPINPQEKFLQNMHEGLDFLKKTSYNSFRVAGCGSVWLERCLREAEVACSNHVTPIVEKCRL